jgi:outer membrane protein OmpA-like peptidoglycan-associated protein
MIKKKITDLQEEKNEVIKIQKEKELQKRSPKNLQDLNPIETDKGIVLTLEDELFENKKARLLIWSIGKIEKLAKFLKNNPNRKVFIAGFSDDLGTASYNLDFSIRRAEAVAKVLVASGVDSSRIITKGYGEEHPIAENNTQESRTKNRRVEIVILNEGEDIESILNTREILNP